MTLLTAIFPGEIVALIGDKGAGQSTLMKILPGADRPDVGSILLEGRPVTFASPGDAQARGIETVYQDLALASAAGVFSTDDQGAIGALTGLRHAGALGKVKVVAYDAATADVSASNPARNRTSRCHA